MPRIVTAQELLTMPQGTIFTPYCPEMSKGDGLLRLSRPTGHGVDFYYFDLLVSFPNGDGPEYTPDDGARWGNFDEDEKFIVYTPEDVKKMISHLDGSAKIEE